MSAHHKGGATQQSTAAANTLKHFFVPLKNHQSDESTFLDTDPLALSLLFSGPMFFSRKKDHDPRDVLLGAFHLLSIEHR